MSRSSAGAALLSAAALLVSGCAGVASSTEATTPVPPSRLTVGLPAGDGGSFRVTLDCDIVDRAACAAVLDTIAEARDAARCAPIADSGRSISISGRIDGTAVRAEIPRRTDCEARLYDRITQALGPRNP